MSSANRQRRQQNRTARVVAQEEALRRTRRQRITLAGIGLILAIVVAVVLVARAKSNGNSTASSSTSTTTTPADTSSTSSTTTTLPPSVAGKPCVAMTGALPAGAPAVPVQVGPPPTKLVTKDLVVGTGAVVKANATVTVNYIGVACSTGKIFDSSYSRHQAFTTPLGEVVKGWGEGIPGMRVGGERLLGIPPALGYGDMSPGPGIDRNETLWFVVQMVKAT